MTTTVTVTTSTGPTVPPGVVLAPRGVIYLPQVYVEMTVALQGEQFMTKAEQIFHMMILHPEQGRKELEWHPLLAEVARDKCYYQAHQGWSGHVDPEGYGPNYWVREYGYRLPDWWLEREEPDSNYIESLQHNGDGDVSDAWAGWMHSDGHRIHILGLNSFYAEQTQVGVGYYYLESSEKRHYWAVITAPKEPVI